MLQKSANILEQKVNPNYGAVPGGNERCQIHLCIRDVLKGLIGERFILHII